MTISYESSGSGPAVVMLHAGVADRRMWSAQVADLVTSGYRVVTLDLRGFGRTPAADAPYNEADDVLEVLDELGLDRVALVGSSFGGRVAVEVAARWPARVAALMLLCSAHVGHQPSAELAAFGGREDVLLEAGDVDGAVDLNVDLWCGPDASEDVRALVHRMQRRAFELQLGAPEVEEVEYAFDPRSISARTLVVSGEHDVHDFGQIAEHLSGVIPGSRHVRLDWAGHLPSLERPAEITELLRAFLDDAPW